MDKKVKAYAKTIENYLQREANESSIPGIEFQVIIDAQNNHLQLVETGWYENRFIHFMLYHFQIKNDGKIWLWANETDNPVAEELVKMGIPASDIVIGFHSASVRKFTEFAVG
jgi:hypothetical protein